MDDRLTEVKVLIDAKIAAKVQRLALHRQHCRENDFIPMYGLPPTGNRSCGTVCRRLPDELQVPRMERRSPNLKAMNLSFAARVVMAVRDRFGGDAPRVYSAAGITRQAYSQIVSDETHPVSKRTAIRLVFALHCNPREAEQLLKSAGYAFSNAKTEDFILQSCLEMRPPIWNFDDINQLLSEYNVDYRY